MKTVTIIEEEVAAQISEIHKMELGTEETKAAIDGAVKLAGIAAELQKNELAEKQAKIEEAKIRAAAEAQIAEEKDRKVKNWLTALGITVPAAGAIWANIYNWNKEVDGVMTFSLGKKAMDFLSKFKK